MRRASSSTRSTCPAPQRPRPASAWSAIFACSALALAACNSCKNGGDAPTDAATSPQAKAEPAPIASPAVTSSVTAPPTTTNPDGGPPPAPLRGDRDLPPDVVKEPSREPPPPPPKDGGPPPVVRRPGDLSGYTLLAVMRVSDVPAPPKSAEVSSAGLEAARRRTEPRFTIDLSQTRARIVLASSGFVLPLGTELRSRLDRYGHLVLLPEETTYRIAAPGALRALLGERRLDVAPLAVAEVTPHGEGTKRANVPTQRFEVATRAAKATIEIATLKDAGDGGILLCRALLDLISAHPSTPLCATEQVPLHAELHWTTKGVLTFDVVALTRRHDLQATQVAAPPPERAFTSSPIPADAAQLLLSKGELSALRTGPVEIPSQNGDAQAPPENGLVLANTEDELRMVVIDGVPIAWLAPGARETITALQHGRYLLQWRTFLGDAFEPPIQVTVPGTAEAPDGGAP